LEFTPLVFPKLGSAQHTKGSAFPDVLDRYMSFGLFVEVLCAAQLHNKGINHQSAISANPLEPSSRWK